LILADGYVEIDCWCRVGSVCDGVSVCKVSFLWKHQCCKIR